MSLLQLINSGLSVKCQPVVGIPRPRELIGFVESLQDWQPGESSWNFPFKILYLLFLFFQVLSYWSCYFYYYCFNIYPLFWQEIWKKTKQILVWMRVWKKNNNWSSSKWHICHKLEKKPIKIHNVFIWKRYWMQCYFTSLLSANHHMLKSVNCDFFFNSLTPPITRNNTR